MMDKPIYFSLLVMCVITAFIMGLEHGVGAGVILFGILMILGLISDEIIKAIKNLK